MKPQSIQVQERQYMKPQSIQVCTCMYDAFIYDCCLTFSTVRFKCLFKLHCRKYALSNRLPKKMHSRIYCICLIFLHCVFSNAASNCLHYMKYDHTHVA